MEAKFISDGDLLSRFESLGDTCEFGFVQRQAGIEPVSLLRWIGLGHHQKMAGNDYVALRLLIDALREKFVALDDPDDIEILPPWSEDWKEFGIRSKAYDMYGHTQQFSDKTSIEAVSRQYKMTLPRLKDFFIESLYSPSKILVYRSLSVHPVSDMTDLLTTLRTFGDNTLLWVVEAPGGESRGKIEWLGDHLLIGYIDRLTKYGEANKGIYEDWVQICRRALSLSAFVTPP